MSSSLRPTPHCSDEELNDQIDGRLDAADRARVARHCAACGACRARREAFERVVAAARQVPATITPPDPDALLAAVRDAARDARRRGGRFRSAAPVQVLPAAACRTDRHVPAWPATGRRRTALLAAGIVAVAAASSLTTARLVRRGGPQAPTVAEGPPAAGPPAAGPPAAGLPTASPPSRAAAAAPTRLTAGGGSAGAPAISAAVRGETDRTLAELRAAAAAGDQVLAAETLRVLERSLATVDAAIAEAEAALARDPGNAALAALLTRTYEQKRELVRRGAFLGSRT